MPPIKELLQTARTIAVVGCSERPDRISHTIARYLQEAGYRVIPVNPKVPELLGETCYPSLSDVPLEAPIDIVNVFRKPAFTAGVVQEAAARAERTQRKPTIWTQLGVSSPEAERLAEEAGLPYVRDRCIYVDHRSLL